MLIKLLAVDNTMLSASNVAENDYAEWDAGTTYAADDYVIVIGTTHKVYISLQGGNLNKDPTDAANSAWWLEVSATNRWKAFDDKPLQKVARADEITYDFLIPTDADGNTIAVNGVAFNGLEADEVTVQVKDGGSPSYTNLVADADTEDFTTGSYTATDCTVTADQGVNSYGATLADRITKTNAAGTLCKLRIVLGNNIAPGGNTYTVHLEMAAPVPLSGNVRLVTYAGDPFDAGTTQSTSHAVGTTPARYAHTFTVPSTASNDLILEIQIGGACDAGEYVDVFGLVAETGASASEYFPQNGLVYERTLPAIASSLVDGAWDYAYAPFDEASEVTFRDLTLAETPAYSGDTVSVAITRTGGTARVGQVSLGYVYPIGYCVEDSERSFLDFSVITRDAFGNATVTPGQYAPTASYNFLVPTLGIQRIAKLLESLVGTPAVYLPNSSSDEIGLSVFGVLRKFRFREKPEWSLLRIDIEGLN